MAWLLKPPLSKQKAVFYGKLRRNDMIEQVPAKLRHFEEMYF